MPEMTVFFRRQRAERHDVERLSAVPDAPDHRQFRQKRFSGGGRNGRQDIFPLQKTRFDSRGLRGIKRADACLLIIFNDIIRKADPADHGIFGIEFRKNRIFIGSGRIIRTGHKIISVSSVFLQSFVFFAVVRFFTAAPDFIFH